MKGIIFSEFVEMVENEFSIEICNQIIDESPLPSGGAYTSVGTYDYHEMLQLVTKLSEKSGIPIEDLVLSFGNYLFGRFYALYPAVFDNIHDTFDFLGHVEGHVHVEVRKLYTDTELPTFETLRPDEQTLIMVYRSKRPFSMLALGLIQGCIKHYNENIDVEWQDLSTPEMNHARFTLKKIPDQLQ
jgi:hypothetical protein